MRLIINILSILILKKYVQNVLRGIKEDYWNDSIDRTFLQRKLRAVILNLGCLCGLPSYQTKAYELFKKFLNDKVKPNPDIRFLVYYFGE